MDFCDSFIKILDLKKYFKVSGGVKKALNGVSLDIVENSVVALLGPNGAGKTTLSSILVTLNPCTSGGVFYKGVSIYDNLNNYRRVIGFCPQKPNLIEELTVRQNLEFAGRFFGLNEMDVQKNLQKLSERYVLGEYLDQKPDVLSGGYKQRALLARSLMHNPKIIIFDEPTVGLDPHIRRKFWDEIKQLQYEGMTIILTTHYLEEAEALADYICILEKGKVRLFGEKSKIKSEYKDKRLEDIFVQLVEEEAVV